MNFKNVMFSIRHIFAKIVFVIGFLAGMLVLIGCGFIWYTWGDISDFLDVDRCMDWGGAARDKYCELEPGKSVPLDCYGASCTRFLSKEDLE